MHICFPDGQHTGTRTPRSQGPPQVEPLAFSTRESWLFTPPRRVLPGGCSPGCPLPSQALASTATTGYSWARKAELKGFQAHMNGCPVSSPWQCPGQSKRLRLPVEWLGWTDLALECSAVLNINCPVRPLGWLGSPGFPLCPRPHKAGSLAGPWKTPGLTGTEMRPPMSWGR